MRKFRCIKIYTFANENLRIGDVYDSTNKDGVEVIIDRSGNWICNVGSYLEKFCFEEIIEEINPKDLLETGTVVELRNGKRYLVLRGELQANPYGKQDVIFVGQHGYLGESSYDSNLKCVLNEISWDICKVFKIDHYGSFEDILQSNNYDLIWERKEQKTVKMSAVEILEKLGYSKDDKLEIE